MPIEDPGFNAAQHVINQRAVAAKDDAKAVDAMVKMGKAMEGAHISLTRLTKQVQATDKIFEQAARRGDLFGGRAIIDFYKSSEYLNKAFVKTHSLLSSTFSSLERGSTKATSVLQQYGKDLLGFYDLKERHERESLRLGEESVRIAEEITRQQKHQNGLINDELKSRIDLYDKQKATLAAEKDFLDLEKKEAFVLAAYAATMGQVLDLSYKYQKSFKSIAMDFKGSIGFIGDLIRTVQATGGLASIEDAASAMAELRKQGKSYFEDRGLRTAVTQLAAATDMSAGAAATLARQFKILGGTTAEFQRLSNVFAFFSQQTELTADDVTSLITAAKPLIADFPKELQSKTITSILAVGDAFKKAGFNAEELVKTLDEMRDLTSEEGMKSLAMIARFSGVPMGALMQANIGAQAGAALDARVNWMRMMMARFGTGPIGLATAAGIGAKMGGLGTREELKLAGRMTPEDVARLKEQIKLDEQQATAKQHLQESIDRLLSHPLAQITSFFRGIENFLLGVGVRALQAVDGLFRAIGRFLRYTHLLPVVTSFFQGLGDFLSGPFTKNLTTLATIYLFTLPGKAIPVLVKLAGSLGNVFTLFTKLGDASKLASDAIRKQVEANEALMKSALNATTATEEQAAANGVAGAATLAGAGKGGTAAAEVATAAKEEGMLMKFFGKIAPKTTKAVAGVGGRLMGRMTTLMGSATGLFKFAGSWGMKLIPIVGSILGVTAGLQSAGARAQSEGGWNMGNIIQGVIDVVGGLLMGMGWVGIAISAVLQGVNMLVDWLKEHFGWGKKAAENQKYTSPAAAAAATAGGGGQRNFSTFGQPGAKIPAPGEGKPSEGVAAAARAAAAGGGGGKGHYNPDVWDPILTQIATENGVDPRLLKAIARQEGVAAGDFNPLGISPGGGGPTHYGSIEAGAAGMEAYVKAHLRHFLQVDLNNPESVRNFAKWYSPPDAPNDPNKTNVTEAAGILAAARSLWRGGIVHKRTLATLGESGPEAVVPLNDPDRAQAVIDEANRLATAKKQPLLTPEQTATLRGSPRVGRNVSAAQLATLSPKYASYADVFSQASGYGLDPLYILANAITENVNPAHGNPLGLSSPRSVSKFSEADAKSRILRFFGTLSSPTGPYQGLSTLASMTEKYTPFLGQKAANDLRNTNWTKQGDIATVYANLLNRYQTSGTAWNPLAPAPRAAAPRDYYASLQAPHTADVSARLLDRHVSTLRGAAADRTQDTQQEMLTEMRASGKATKDYYRHLYHKDFLGETLFPDSTAELYRAIA